MIYPIQLPCLYLLLCEFGVGEREVTARGVETNDRLGTGGLASYHGP